MELLGFIDSIFTKSRHGPVSRCVSSSIGVLPIISRMLWYTPAVGCWVDRWVGLNVGSEGAWEGAYGTRHASGILAQMRDVKLCEVHTGLSCGRRVIDRGRGCAQRPSRYS